MKKMILVLVGIVLVSFIYGSIFLAQTMPASAELNLGVDAKNELLEKNDWIIGELTENDPDLIDLTHKVQEIVESKDESTLKSIYVGRYINPANNTLFITVTDLDSNKLQDIIDELNPETKLKIIFKQSKYSFTQLNAAYKAIDSAADEMIKNGVPLTGCGIKGKGYIWIELEEVNSENIQSLLSFLPEYVPRDALVIRKGSKATDASLTEKHRPLVAGIQVTCQYGGPTTLQVGSLGFYGTDSSGTRGILTCAHIITNGLYDTAWQPVYGVTNNIGECLYRGTDDSDSAFIELDYYIYGAYQIHPDLSGYDYVVEYQTEYDDITEGAFVRYVGKNSSFVGTTVENKGGKMSGSFGWLSDQIWLDDPCQHGDSGGACYSQVYVGDNKYDCTAYGIVWGFDTYTYVSPIDNIESDFGTTLDLTN